MLAKEMKKKKNRNAKNSEEKESLDQVGGISVVNKRRQRTCQSSIVVPGLTEY